MAHPVSNATQAPKVQQAQEAPKAQAPKPSPKAAAPEDKVTISGAARKAQGSEGKGGKK
jgi:hypothetical protein